MVNQFWTYLDSILETLLFLSCKNVNLSERGYGNKVEKWRRKKTGNQGGVRYHVLTVKPAGSGANTAGQDIGQIPRHMCRGHFSEYGPKYGKGLLFGKYEGRFYVPPHTKGDAKNGRVHKDYKVSQ